MSIPMNLDAVASPATIAKAMAAARTEVQVEVLAQFARLLEPGAFDAILREVQSFAGEAGSIALCRLARALNERDVGPSPNEAC